MAIMPSSTQQSRGKERAAMALQLALTSVNSSTRELPWLWQPVWAIPENTSIHELDLCSWASYYALSWDGPTFFWPWLKECKCVYTSLLLLKCLNTTVPKQEAIDDWVCAKYKIACLWHTVQYYQEHSIQIVWESAFRASHTPNLYPLKSRLKRV